MSTSQLELFKRIVYNCVKVLCVVVSGEGGGSVQGAGKLAGSPRLTTRVTDGRHAMAAWSSCAPAGRLERPAAAGKTHEVRQCLGTLTSPGEVLAGRRHQSPSPRNNTQWTFCVRVPSQDADPGGQVSGGLHAFQRWRHIPPHVLFLGGLVSFGRK